MLQTLQTVIDILEIPNITKLIAIYILQYCKLLEVFLKILNTANY